MHCSNYITISAAGKKHHSGILIEPAAFQCANKYTPFDHEICIVAYMITGMVW